MVFNTIVPALFASSFASAASLWAVAATVLVGIVAGLLLARTHMIWVRRATVGGLFVGVTQLFPILQMAVGILSIGFLEAIEVVNLDDNELLGNGSGSLTPLEAVPLTAMVGMALLLIGLIPGSIVLYLKDHGVGPSHSVITSSDQSPE